MQIHKKARLGAAALAAVAVASLGLGFATPANADPVGAPTYRALAGVGSDTTQDLNNGLSQVVTGSTGAKLIASYDAIGSATIKTKSTGATFNRPNGSGAGVSALKAAKTGGAYGGVTLSSTDLQFARSSSAPSTTSASGTYSYIPLALDAVSYARNSAGSVPSDLTKSDLTKIYTAANGASVSLSVGTYTVGVEGSGAQIVPFLPQANSGTRSFWLGQLGVTSIGSAVSDTYGSSTSVQEHDGSVVAAVTNAIVPFSIAQYIAQGNSSTLSTEYSVTVADRRHGAVLGSVEGVAPTSSGALNTSFPIARPVFTVVQYAELSSNANLAATFSGATAKAYTAKRPGSTTQLVITDFGFGDLTGGVTINGKTYTPGDIETYRTN